MSILDPAGEREDTLVQIVVRDGKLQLITEDRVPLDSVELALDAERGILLGKLELREPPSFLILSSDPREDFEVLLNTAHYARFAINRGQIVRNQLPLAARTLPGEEPRRSGWMAYSPPPISLPLSLRNPNKWNRWESRYVSGIFIGILALDRQGWQSQDGSSKSQVGDLEPFNGGEVRALRLGAVGTLNFPTPWTYTVFAVTNAFSEGFDAGQVDSLQLFDLRVDIPTSAGTTLSVGKQKEPFSMERSMSQIYLPLQERGAALDALLPSRNIGAVFSGTGADQDMSWAAGIFNDWWDDGDAISDGSNQYVGRLTFVPWSSAGESSLLHLGLGLRYSEVDEGLRYSTQPEFKQAPLFVDTGIIGADSSLTYDLEASWRNGPLWLSGEFLRDDVSAPNLGDPRFYGHLLTASWALTGEMRDYDRRNGTFLPLPVARPVAENGWGAWELATRWSTLDTNAGLVRGGEMDIYSLGLTWWLASAANVSLNYRWVTLDDGLGEVGHSNGFMLRVSLILE